MELIDFLIRQREILKDIENCLEREKQALIKEEAKSLLEIIGEKQEYINALDTIEKKRSQTYPNLNLRKMEQEGTLPLDIKKVGNQLRYLTQKILGLQEVNALLTKQSLEYTNTMISILQGSERSKVSSYSSDGEIGNHLGQSNSILDASV